jgi:hypothetical protein
MQMHDIESIERQVGDGNHWIDTCEHSLRRDADDIDSAHFEVPRFVLGNICAPDRDSVAAFDQFSPQHLDVLVASADVWPEPDMGDEDVQLAPVICGSHRIRSSLAG